MSKSVGPLRVYITCKLFPYFLLLHDPTLFIIKAKLGPNPQSLCAPGPILSKTLCHAINRSIAGELMYSCL